MYAEIFVSGVLDQVGIDERLLHMARAAHQDCTRESEARQ